MKKTKFKYEAPRIEIMEVVLEKGIAVTTGGSDIGEIEPGDPWGDY